MPHVTTTRPRAHVRPDVLAQPGRASAAASIVTVRPESRPHPDAVPGGGLARTAYVPLAGAVQHARLWAAVTCADWRLSQASTGAVVLLVSELVTNAVVHAKRPAGATVVPVELALYGGSLRIAVTDYDQALPRLVEAGAEDEEHRGLAIVDAMSDLMGWQATETGKTVSALLTVEAIEVAAR